MNTLRLDMNVVEHMNRMKVKHQERQKRYIGSKIDQGYVELRVWLLCDKKMMCQLKQVLKQLSEHQIKQIINDYID